MQYDNAKNEWRGNSSSERYSGLTEFLRELIVGHLPDISVRELPLDRDTFCHLSTWFQQFYSVPPWSEASICPRCKAASDFGPSDVYPFNTNLDIDHNCPKCGSRFEKFWSVNRVAEYLIQLKNKPGFFSFSTTAVDTITGWIVGYELPSKTSEDILKDRLRCTYIDLIGVLPAFRSLESVHARIMALNPSGLSKWPILQSALQDYQLSPVSPHASLLYLCALALSLSRSADVILTRTHNEAHAVQYLLKRAGFAKLATSDTDRMRSYWLKSLHSPDIR